MPNEHHSNILIRLQSGDRAALQQLFYEHHAMIRGAIHRLIPDHSTAEDLAQEVFVRFWEKREQIHITSSVSAYLRRMAINEALAYLRRQQRFREEEMDPQLSELSTDNGVEMQLLHSELEQRIRSAIDTLPPKCKAIFQLSRFEEMTYQEIADQLDISIKTVENQMGKALRILRELLKDYLHPA